jgi:hypothetical protein
MSNSQRRTRIPAQGDAPASGKEKSIMGGINHQPCGRYLSRSTKVSRCPSVGIIHLESANVAFEDLILCELAGRRGDIAPILAQLYQASECANGFIGALNHLIAQMDEEGYQDLPPLGRLDLTTIGQDFMSRGLTDGAWHEVVAIVRQGGFYALFDEFKMRATTMTTRTAELLAAFEANRPLAESATLSMVLEENRRGNVRPHFAQTYTAWYGLHGMFLASSLLSSEVWYAFNGNGSMAETSTLVMVG